MSTVFHPNRQPALKPGTYTLTAALTLQAGGRTLSFPSANSPLTRTFTISGRHLTLDAGVVASVFPPANSIGDHSNVLPHVTLSTPTLPWERSIQPGRAAATNDPWLALLLFVDGDEFFQTKVLTGAQFAAQLPGFTVENEERADQVTILEFDRALVASIIPARGELALLAHIRETPSGAVAEVVCNRLPAAGRRNTVHLVSMEARYSGDSFNAGPGSAAIQLISLASWSFNCQETYRFSEGALAQLGPPLTPAQTTQLLAIGTVNGRENLVSTVERVVSPRRLSDPEKVDLTRLAQAETFHGLLLNLNRNPGQLRLPPVNNAAAERFLSWGAVPLPHRFRTGQDGISWYHGPFSTATLDSQSARARPRLPSNSSDNLVRYHTDAGMFDVSYAAAWELGRLLAIRNARFAFDLYNWRRAVIRGSRVGGQLRQAPNLDVFDAPRATAAPIPLPQTVVDFLERLGKLEEVPFNYLVASNDLLPAESIRFFTIDRAWMRCLLDGAFSVGRAALDFSTSDRGIDLDTFLPPFTGGFLLRSDLVSGWPRMGISALPVASAPVPLTRPRLFGSHVLCCLMNVSPPQVEFALDEEGLHFGFEPTVNGFRLASATNTPVPFRGRRVVDIRSLAGANQPDEFAARILASPMAVRIGAPLI